MSDIGILHWTEQQRPIPRMPHHVRELSERREAEMLSPYAAKAAESRGRERDEAPDPVRTCFQRDRDRILHSKSFRRLKHKTQVFIEPFGDHYRTRLTHSLEVAQIARTVGRALRLNEDLIEAIALGHDVGHTPFGHAGESALDEAIRERCGEGGFKHHEQSLRVLDVLEGLNLTHETRQGVGGHSKGRSDLSAHDGEATSTLEAAVVRISDRIAYMNHDLDDALRAGIVKEIPPEVADVGASHGKRIGAMVEDVIVNSLDQPAIRLSPKMLSAMNHLKEWLFENVYLLYPVLYPDIPKARGIVRDLFLHYCEPGNLPDGFNGVQGAIDYVSGMTDRFAMDEFARLKLPRGFRQPPM
jgi:dGTPase